MLMGRTGYEPLALSRLACDVGADDAPESRVCRNVLALLEGQEAFRTRAPGDGPPLAPGIRSIMLAACISRTPDVPLPALAERIRGDELRAEAAAGTAPSRRRGSSGCPRRSVRPICADRPLRITF